MCLPYTLLDEAIQDTIQKAHSSCFKMLQSILQNNQVWESYEDLNSCHNSEKVDSSMGYNQEAIQHMRVRFCLASYIHKYYLQTKFRPILRRSLANFC